jgi:hypothetical protein
LKIHIAVNIKSKKIISIELTDEHFQDSKVLSKLVEYIVKSKNMTIGKVFVDEAYDSNAIFCCLANNGILSCIKERRNAKVKKTNNIISYLLVTSQKNDCKNWTA